MIGEERQQEKRGRLTKKKAKKEKNGLQTAAYLLIIWDANNPKGRPSRDHHPFSPL